MLIHNATVITFDETNRILPNGAVRYDGDAITHVGDSADLLAQFPDDERWDAGGLVLMPGQICAHTHFYGAFARGMYIPGAPAKDFPEILDKLWWPLDRSLDLDGVRSSAEVCLVDAIRNGTTTLIDHHASQTAIDGSLDAIAEAVDASGSARRPLLRSHRPGRRRCRQGRYSGKCAVHEKGSRRSHRPPALVPVRPSRGHLWPPRQPHPLRRHPDRLPSRGRALPRPRGRASRGRVRQPGPVRPAHGGAAAQLRHHRPRHHHGPLHPHRRLGDWPCSRRPGPGSATSPAPT